MIIAEISGVRRKLKVDSLSYEDRIEERSVCSFILEDNNELLDFEEGEPVIIYYYDEVSPFTILSKFNFASFNFSGFTGPLEAEKEIIFEGFVRQSERKVLRVFPTVYSRHLITCVDNHYLADKRLVAKSYENEDVNYIVNDLFTEYLEDEGITIGQIDSGVVLAECVFNYIPVSQALDNLCDRTGWSWKIDKYRKLYFTKRESVISSLEATESIMLYNTITLKRDNSKYRNRQVIKGARDLTSEQTEIFIGDGSAITFSVGYPIAKAPTIKYSSDGINYTTKTVGIRGLDSGFDWYWSSGENQISQDIDGTILTSSEYLKVEYQGEFELIVISQDNVAIANRLSVEDIGTGRVEAIESASELVTREASFELARQLLAKYSEEGRILTFTTRESSFESGQLLTVDMSSYEVDTEMLIESVSMYSNEKENFYTVVAVEGPTNQSWANLFTSLYEEAQFKDSQVSSVGEIVIIPYQFEKTWTEAEVPNIYTEIYPSLTLTPASDLYPSFDPDDKVKYLEVYNSGGAISRKAITQSSEDVFNITILSSSDYAGEDITEFAWIGGIDATITLGTGVEVDSQTETTDGQNAPFSKTSLETWQIEKTDTKGW